MTDPDGNEGDLGDQRTSVDPDLDDLDDLEASLPIEADPADAADQRRTVPEPDADRP